MISHWTKRSWFGFKDSCVAVEESGPSHGNYTYNQTLFFVHGRFGQSGIWDPLIQQLAPRCRCIAPDLPGFGRSFVVRERGFTLLEHAMLVQNLIERFSPQDHGIILVGHDVGGAIAELSLLKFPHQVSALILINSCSVGRKLARIGTGLRGWLAKWKFLKLLDQSHLSDSPFKDQMLMHWSNANSKTDFLRSIDAFEENWPMHYERQFWKKELASIPQPVLLLWGKKDPINPPDIGAELLQKLPDAYFYVHDQSGHWPSLEHPDWVLSRIREFLFKIRASESVRLLMYS